MNALITPRLFFGLETSAPAALGPSSSTSPCSDFANLALFSKPEIPDEIGNKKGRKPEFSTLTNPVQNSRNHFLNPSDCGETVSGLRMP
jgi:hypothetical protein